VCRAQQADLAKHAGEKRPLLIEWLTSGGHNIDGNGPVEVFATLQLTPSHLTTEVIQSALQLFRFVGEVMAARSGQIASSAVFR
jgi:hypothetical protein